MEKKSIQRRVKQARPGNQFSLGLSGGSSAAPATPALAGPVIFNDPDPRLLQVAGTDLQTHLLQCGHEDVFIIRTLLEEQDWSAFEAIYKSGGRRPYKPRSMLGLILYGILNGRSSLRELEYLAGVDLGCWWLTGGIMPDHSVIGRFIQQHAALLTDDFFESLTRSVLKATRSGTSRTSGDGTVIEAAASRYRTVKREALDKQIEHTRQRLAEASDDADKTAAENRLEQLTTAGEALAQRAAKRESKGKDPDKTQINPAEVEAVLQPLKRQGYGAAYKPSVLANEKRVILSQAVDPSSETAVVENLFGQAERLGKIQESSLDAGYHCEAILGLAEPMKISLLIPEGRTTAADWKKQSDKQYPKSQFVYDANTNTYRCPAGERLSQVGQYQGNATQKPYVEYGTPACADCKQREHCTKSVRGRRVKRYPGDEYKEAMREKLQDEAVQQRYRQRAGAVEPVFSQLKGKQGLNRFRRKGLAAVRVEFALHALAYNVGRAIALKTVLMHFIAWLRILIRGILSQNPNNHAFWLTMKEKITTCPRLTISYAWRGFTTPSLRARGYDVLFF